MFFLEFLICFCIGINGMLTIGLVSDLRNVLIVPKNRGIYVLCIYILLTFTITFMTRQMLGLILLNYLPFLALYRFLNTQWALLLAVIVKPFIYLTYCWMYGNEVILADAIGIVVLTYLMLGVLIYVLNKCTSSVIRWGAASFVVGSLEILNQVLWHQLFTELTVLVIIMNIIAYLVAILLMDVLYLKLVQQYNEDYREKYIDKLTNLYNYNSFKTDFKDRDLEDNYIIAVVDVNEFKNINDTYGHDRGNEILQLVSDLIAKGVAEKYSMLNYKVYRYGGEEIIVVVKLNAEYTVSDGMNEMSNVLKSINRNLNDVTEKLLNKNISFSAGISASELCGFDDEATFNRADRLLYQAKADKETVVVIDDGVYDT